MTSDDIFLTLDDMSFIRGTSLLGFPELVRELGGEPRRLLAQAHITEQALGDPDAFINVRGVIDLLEIAADVTGTPDFGRRLATRQGIEILGPVGVAARTAATVGAALQAVDQYMSVYSPALSATVDAHPSQRQARLDWRILSDRPPPHRQSAELSIGVALRVFRLLAGPDFTPVVVNFRHEPLTSVKEYARYFGSPVRFGKPATELVFHRSVLDRPLNADSAVHDVVREYLGSITPSADVQGVAPVRLLIRRMLPTGGLTLELVAAHLAMHPRTLQRHLASLQTSFAGLVEEVRRDEAARYLRETDVPLGQLAGILGYSEQSVLSRSCRRWFGKTPRQYRAHLNATRTQ